MFEIDGTAYLNKSSYKRCLEKMKSSSKRTIRLFKRMYERAQTEEEKQLIKEAHATELNRLAYAHFNLAWLKNPEVFNHYGKIEEEQEGAENDA